MPLVYSKSFDLAAGATETTNYEIDGDLSRARSLLLELVITEAQDDADDSLDVKFQDTTDRVVWNTRARFATIAGNVTVSASAPEVRRLALLTEGLAIESTEEGYEPSGSAGASELAAGAVLNGPLPARFRNSTGQLAAYRFSLVKTDTAGDDAEFSGTLKVWANY